MKRLFKTFCVAASLTAATLIAGDAPTSYKDNSILISAEEAVKLIGNPKVMFVSGDSEDVYKLGHIKGSVSMYAHHLHHSNIMGDMHCEPLYRCLDDAENYISSKGIANDMMVIAYDDFKGPNATGVYSFFKSYGHTNVKLLNGGRSAIMSVDPEQLVYNDIKAEWKKEKKIGKKAKKKLKKHKKGKITLTEAQITEFEAIMKVSKKKAKAIKKRLDTQAKNLLVIKGDENVARTDYHINKDHLDLSNIADKHEMAIVSADILKNGKDSKFVIIDSRGMAEIIGERKMDNVARGGHIPGSVFMEWKKTSDLDNKKSFKQAAELQKAFDHYGITKDKTIYAYCMVGAGRGSQQITALQLLGYKNVKVFTGSWDTWGNDMNLPLKK
jgi:thiosulfate/3-mercaptopyruvate sulfurtransferase